MRFKVIVLAALVFSAYLILIWNPPLNSATVFVARSAQTFRHTVPTSLEPVEAFASIFQRPLFVAKREMTQNEPPGDTSATPPHELPVAKAPSFALIGISVTPVRQVALVAEKAGASPLHLVEGDEISGWKLERVNARTLEFSKDNRSVVLAFEQDEE